MRLIVYVDVYRPDHAGGAAVYTDFCEAAAAMGHLVTVRCAYPYFPEWQDKSGQNGWRIRREHLNGVDVERHGQWLPSRRSAAQRLLAELSYLLSLLRSLVGRDHHDAVLVFSTRFPSLAVGALHSRTRRIPLTVSVQDISFIAAAATGYTRASWLAQAWRWLELGALRSADRLATIAPGMAEGLRAHDATLDPVVIPNWPNRSMSDTAADLDVSRALEPGAPRILYAGNIGKKQGLLDLCRRLHAEAGAFRLRIHASGPGAAEIAGWLEQVHDDRFELGPFLPEADFLAELAAADLFLISELPSPGDAYMPSKLIPSLLVGTPVLAVCRPDGSLGREVSAHGLGRVVAWDALGPGAMALDLDEWQAWHRACLRRAQLYDRAARVDELLELVRAAAAQHRARSRRARVGSDPC